MPRDRRFSQLLHRLQTRCADLPQTLHLIWQATGRWSVVWAGLLLLQGLVPAVQVSLSRQLIDQLARLGGQGFGPDTLTLLAPILAGIGGALVFNQLAQSLLQWVRIAQSELLQDHITALVHQKSTLVDYGFFEASEFYDHLDQARSEASSRSLALLENTGNFAQAAVTLLSLMALLVAYGWWLPLALVISTLPALLVMVRLNREYHRWWEGTTGDRRRLQYYNILLTVREAAAEIRLFNLGSYFRREYQTSRAGLRRQHLRLQGRQSLGKFTAGLAGLAVALGLGAWLGWQLLYGRLTLGDLALFYQAFTQVQDRLQSLLGSVSQIYKNSLFLRHLFEFLQLPNQVREPQQPQAMPQGLRQGIEFTNVSFTYPGSSDPALENFNLSIPAGQVVAIVGDNGAGKSTLSKLLCRFYDPDCGEITWDGISLRDLMTVDLRRQITMLFQFPVAYYVSAQENIRLGDLSLDDLSLGDPSLGDLGEANALTPAITTAAQRAGIHDKIMQLPQGYQAQMGKLFSDGHELSGGQWQRLAMARAFYRQAPLIVLDEPTSAMDPWAERDWLQRFRDMAQGRTAVVITHRFTLARQADLIYVMQAGKIVESGSHEELLAHNGRYAESWRSQMHTPADLVAV
jgi:ATP-binding cassette, subfamily B, bacterial